MKMMPFQEFKELIKKSDYNKWTKMDMFDLMEEHPEYADLSKEELLKIVNKLNWDAEGYFDQANSLENEASLIRDLIEIMYGE